MNTIAIPPQTYEEFSTAFDSLFQSAELLADWRFSFLLGVSR